MASVRGNLLCLGKLAKQANRHEDMVDSMKKLANLNVQLTVEERILLSIAYKNVLQARRSSWLTLASSAEHNKNSLTNDYLEKIKAEIMTICNDVISLVDKQLSLGFNFSSDNNNADDNLSALLFYYRMKGDYSRYKAEVNDGDEKEKAVNQSLKAFEAGLKLAEQSKLAPTHPKRLGLVLHLSVLYYEIMGCSVKAYHLAKQAFDEGFSLLKTTVCFDEETVLILQLLKQNLAWWNFGEIPEDVACCDF